ncbi:MAG: toprim domain-containing protein [Planctomycetes bacterium]|nr:toprim domain-containing protein [Planctomycetota bacterium]
MSLGPVAGGAVRLGLAGRELAICEGIESALSFQQATQLTAWAALSVSGVRSLVLPEEISAVVLGPDGDDPGDGAAVDAARRFIKSEIGARAVSDLTAWFERQWAESVDFKDDLIELLDSSKFGTKEYTPYEVYIKALYEYFKESLGDDPLVLGRSAVELAEFQDDAVRKARRILDRYDGVLIADSVGLGKTWIGKKLLEDFSYHRRQKAVVICPASLRAMWRKELASATIAAEVVGMEELGREGFNMARIGDADCILLDESHNFRNNKSNRYLALDEAIQRNGGRGRDGARKKLIMLSATPINNDIYDLASQVNLFTQNEADYFRDAGIGDLPAYFRRGRRIARQEDASAGIVLFNLLEEIMVRNTRPFIKAAYPNATINGKPVAFPERKLHTVEYDLGEASTGLYGEIMAEIECLSLAPYRLESYRKKSAIRDEQEHEFDTGREKGLVGIFKTRFLKRLESSIYAFRESLRRALVFEETYLDFLLDGTVVSSKDFQKLMRFLARDEEDEPAASSMFEDLDEVEQVREYLSELPTVDLNQYDVRKLVRDVEEDVQLLRQLHERTEQLAASDGKLQRLKELLAGELKGRKVLIFSMFKDTSRYVHRELTSESCASWRATAGGPHVRRIDSGNHPDERGRILGLFAPVANETEVGDGTPIDVLVSTDVLSEGQNLQDCGVIINYDLTWNPVRLVQRNGRIDRIGSPHAEIGIYNMFPEEELENLLHLVERLASRISTIDDLGLLDGSVLGEVVHPRTFNTLRRIRDEDGTVLPPIQEDETAVIPYVLWQHYLKHKDVETITPLYRPLIVDAAAFMSEFRDPHTKLPAPSFDLWEERRAIYSYTVATVWAGLSAAANFAELFGEFDDAERFRRAATEIKEACEIYLYDDKEGRFLKSISVHSDGSVVPDNTIDASLYGLWYFGMFEPNDPRIERTMKAIEDRLWCRTDIGGLARYEGDEYHWDRALDQQRDTIPGNPWIISTLWLAQYRIARAESLEDLKLAIPMIKWTCDRALPSGVLAEQIHPLTGEPLSVSPLTWSHATVVTTVLDYVDKYEQLQGRPQRG